MFSGFFNKKHQVRPADKQVLHWFGKIIFHKTAHRLVWRGLKEYFTHNTKRQTSNKIKEIKTSQMSHQIFMTRPSPDCRGKIQVCWESLRVIESFPGIAVQSSKLQKVMFTPLGLMFIFWDELYNILDFWPSQDSFSETNNAPCKEFHWPEIRVLPSVRSTLPSPCFCIRRLHHQPIWMCSWTLD